MSFVVARTGVFFPRNGQYLYYSWESVHYDSVVIYEHACLDAANDLEGRIF